LHSLDLRLPWLKLIMGSRQQFLRDGDQLAARMTGSIKVNDMDMAFESSIFAKVDESGKMEWLIERAVWGPVGEAPTYGEGLKGETMQ
jgi:hypothetical protein